MSKGWLEFLFLMLLMKVPIVYLCVVVWWAVKAEPRPEEGAARLAHLDPDLPPQSFARWLRGRRPRRPGPHGRPTRKPVRVSAATRARRS